MKESPQGTAGSLWMGCFGEGPQGLRAYFGAGWLGATWGLR